MEKTEIIDEISESMAEEGECFDDLIDIAKSLQERYGWEVSPEYVRECIVEGLTLGRLGIETVICVHVLKCNEFTRCIDEERGYISMKQMINVAADSYAYEKKISGVLCRGEMRMQIATAIAQGDLKVDPSFVLTYPHVPRWL